MTAQAEWEFDLAYLVDSGAIETEETTVTNPLVTLTRNIATQYIEVLAELSTGVFAGRGAEIRPQFLAAVNALRRLAVASDDFAMVEVLDEAEGLLPADDLVGRARDRLFKRMQDWTRRFAELLPESERARMLGVVDVDAAESPLLQELLRVEGIGSKRLERLYCAGLFTVHAVCSASPREIAAVTGMPIRVAERVVETAQTFENERPKRVATNLLRYANQTREALAAVEGGDPRREEILAAARLAVEQLTATLAALDAAAKGESS